MTILADVAAIAVRPAHHVGLREIAPFIFFLAIVLLVVPMFLERSRFHDSDGDEQ